MPWLSRHTIQVFAVCTYALISAPVVAMLVANSHFRHVFFNLLSHYRAKAIPPRSIHVGDSLTAGGRHWSFRLGSAPLDSINLSSNGYTSEQVVPLIKEALRYRPHNIVAMAGVNDAFSVNYIPSSTLSSLREIAALITASSARCIFTLPIPPRNRTAAERVTTLNRELRQLLPRHGCEVIDLGKDLAPNGTILNSYTTDGVHLNGEGYRVWADRLNIMLAADQGS